MNTPRRLLVVVSLISGCVSYTPQPIDPAQVEQEFMARTLDAPGLKGFVEPNMPGKAYPPETWDLRTLTLVAFYYHPDLDVARAHFGTVGAGKVTAGTSPNPTITIAPGYNQSAASGVTPYILAVSLDIPIETAGKRGYRIQRSERQIETARLELGETAWKVRSRLRAALLDYLIALEELELRKAEQKIRTETVALLERRRKAGEVSLPEVYIARTDLASIDLGIVSQEGLVQERHAALASAIGLPEKAIESKTFTWEDLGKPPADKDVAIEKVRRAGLLNRVDIRRALAEYAAAEASLQLEVSKQYPDLHLGPGYTYDQGDNKFSFGPSIALPIFDRNQGPIAEALAARKESAAKFLALQARAIGEIETSLARFRGARAELEKADGLMDLLDKQIVSMKKQVDLGQEDRLALAGVQVQHATTRRQRLDALRKVQSSLGDLEDALQKPFGTDIPEVDPSNPREVKHE